MNKCDACGSYAINHHLCGRDGSEPDLCDVCFWRKRHGVLEAELATLKSAPVVMPEYQDAEDLFHPLMKDRAIGWNNCLDEFERLNRSKTNEQ